MPRRKTLLLLTVVVALLSAVAVGCSLNPQPIPPGGDDPAPATDPDRGDDEGAAKDAGASDSGDGGDGASDGGADGCVPPPITDGNIPVDGTVK